MNSVIELEGKTLNESRQAVEFALGKLNADYYSSDTDTSGFSIRYSSKWYTPYSFNLYIAPFGETSSMVRAESPFMWFQGSMSHALTDVIQQTTTSDTSLFKKEYDSKNLFLANGLTLLSPGLGYWYVNSSSPFGKSLTFMKVFIMLASDAALLWIGSKTFFTHGFDPTGRGLIPMAILGGTYRLMVLPGINMQVIAHNQMVGLGYKFRF